MHHSSYQQPSKDVVRETLLPKAVRCLTTDRNLACVVQASELTATVVQFIKLTDFIPGFSKLERAIMKELQDWLGFHEKAVGQKLPGELKILYLCGPEPLNDLQILVRCGVNPHNVWAVTHSAEDHRRALQECSNANIPLKIHRGSLKEFFDTFNEVFDVIYFDACGPFCGGEHNTLDPIVSLFERQRLASPGVLITNFGEPPSPGDARARIADLVSAYYAPRYRDLPTIAHRHGPDPAEAEHDPALLRVFVTENLTELYSEFITGFLADLAMNVLPSIRALGTTTLFRRHLADDSQYKSLVTKANFEPEFFDSSSTGHIHLSPSSYPLLAFFRTFNEWRPDNVPIKRLYEPRESNRRQRIDLIEASALMNAVFEGHWDVLSESMREAVDCSWFDLPVRVTCDLPLPNLTVNALLGVYGRPSFANPRRSERLSYIAKTQRMYCDLTIFDQCRSFFDWLPVVEACKRRFESIPFQIVARGIMDRIGRHTFSNDAHPFRGAAITGLGEIPCAESYDFEDRRRVN